VCFFFFFFVFFFFFYNKLQLLYVDRVECPEYKVERNVSPLKFWTMERLKEREHAEIKGGGFGRGKLRDLYIDFEDYENSEDETIVRTEGDKKRQTDGNHEEDTGVDENVQRDVTAGNKKVHKFEF
jgi:hypothetical protein